MVVIDFVRHAQGYHNLSNDNLTLPDPQLTPLGEQQCATLCAKYPYHDQVRLLVASPLRRTLKTCLLSFAPAAARGLQVVAVPELQEVSAMPSDVGSDQDVLAKEFAGQVDVSRAGPGWNHKGPDSPFAPEMSRLEARARQSRIILRDLIKSHGLLESDDPSARVCVVSHGGILHFITEDYGDIKHEKGTGWENTELRSYEFVDPTGASDPDAHLRETSESWQARKGTAHGLTETEQREFRAVYHGLLTDEIAHGVKVGMAVTFPTDYATAAAGSKA